MYNNTDIAAVLYMRYMEGLIGFTLNLVNSLYNGKCFREKLVQFGVVCVSKVLIFCSFFPVVSGGTAYLYYLKY